MCWKPGYFHFFENRPLIKVGIVKKSMYSQIKKKNLSRKLVKLDNIKDICWYFRKFTGTKRSCKLVNKILAEAENTVILVEQHKLLCSAHHAIISID